MDRILEITIFYTDQPCDVMVVYMLSPLAIVPARPLSSSRVNMGCVGHIFACRSFHSFILMIMGRFRQGIGRSYLLSRSSLLQCSTVGLPTLCCPILICRLVGSAGGSYIWGPTRAKLDYSKSNRGRVQFVPKWSSVSFSVIDLECVCDIVLINI